MKKNYTPAGNILCFLVFLLCGVQTIHAQNVADAKTSMAMVQRNAAAIGFSAAELKNIRISDTYYDKLSGATLVYVQQTWKGVDVYNAIKVLAFKNEKLVSVAGTTVKSIETGASFSASPVVSAADAVRAAATHLKLVITSAVYPILTDKQNPNEAEFGKLGISGESIKTKLLWMPIENSREVKLAWQVSIQPNKTPDYWQVNIDAQNGGFIHKKNLTVYDNWGTPEKGVPLYTEENKNLFNAKDNNKSVESISTAKYRVVAFPAEAPSFPGGTPSVQQNPWEAAGIGSTATTLKWNDDGTTTFDSTDGNNVLSVEDRNANNTGGEGANSTTAIPNLTFNFIPDFTLDPTTTTNQNFNITNLFYWNNIMHDITYLYGFDEVSGNFQTNNLSRGGAGNDKVFADAQDGSGTNNANFSTPADGSHPRMQMYLFTSPTPDLDGDADNGVIGHEYTHGISNRLTGGPSNVSCLQNAEQGGEGWSDYYAIMTTTNWATALVTDGANAHPIGTYVLNQLPTGPGIRTHPYSTNMTIDSWTYADLAGSGGEVHVVGEIWCTALWEMTWQLIQTNGITPNLYDTSGTGGNVIALKLVTEGMKLQPCSPGFIDARNAILKADTILFGGVHVCDIYKAFAKRGMGLNALQGSSSSSTDQTADFTSLATTIVKKSSKSDVSQKEKFTYTLTVKCGCEPIKNYKIVDTLAKNISYVSGGVYNAGNKTVTFDSVTLASGASKDYKIKVKVKKNAYSAPDSSINEPVAGSTIPAEFVSQSTSGLSWGVSTTVSHSSPNSLFVQDMASAQNAALVTVGSYLLKGVSTLSFWHNYNVENTYDGGVVEISTDGGTSWIDLGPYMTSHGYNGTLNGGGICSQILLGRHAFTGNSGGFVQTTVNLAAFAGQTVKLRFLFGSDCIVGVTGWYVDDILLTNAAAIINTGRLFDKHFVVQDSSTVVTTINNLPFFVAAGNFTAEKKSEDAALLKWNTNDDAVSDKYAIERSTDGLHFVQIGFVPSAGENDKANDYVFTDNAPVIGTNYYRLKRTNGNNEPEYSQQRVVDFTNKLQVSISPNPAKDQVTITVNGNNKLLQITLLGTTGQKVKSFSMKGQSTQLNLPPLAPGVYYVQITGNGINSKHKLVIE